MASLLTLAILMAGVVFGMGILLLLFLKEKSTNSEEIETSTSKL